VFTFEINFIKLSEKIQLQAELVLEENKTLHQQLKLEQKKVAEIQKNHIQELGRMSKRILICETDRVNLLNQIDVIKINSEEILKKYNDSSVEASRRIKLDEHLNQIGDLKRKIEEINLNYKQDIENLTLKLQVIQYLKKFRFF
jgi:hypothetical protein